MRDYSLADGAEVAEECSKLHYFAEKESNVHFLHVPFSDKPVPYYSLDVIISVGYRVKSKRGTQFCIWANRILKDYLVKGYAINNNIASRKYEELCHLVQNLRRTAKQHELHIYTVSYLSLSARSAASALADPLPQPVFCLRESA